MKKSKKSDDKQSKNSDAVAFLVLYISAGWTECAIPHPTVSFSLDHHIYTKSDGGCCCRDPPMIIFFLFPFGSFCYSRVIFFKERVSSSSSWVWLSYCVLCGCPPLFCSASFYLSVAGQLSERLSIHVHIYRSSVFSLSFYFFFFSFSFISSLFFFLLLFVECF
jgi:hypothetical protein